MRISGVLPPDAPDPRIAAEERVRNLGFGVLGFAPQPALEDFGALGFSSMGDGSETSVSVSYTLWRTPDDRDDTANLAELDDATRAALDEEPPWPRPTWLIEGAQRMRYPVLWEAVRTTWNRTPSEHTTVAQQLISHTHHILMNRFRDELGLSDMPSAPGFDPFAPQAWHPTASSVNPAATLEVDGVARPASEIDTDPFVYAIGADLGSGLVVTVVVPRVDLPFVDIALAGRAS